MKWLLILLIFVISSCRIQRKIYSPLPVNNPSLEEKNDYAVNATVGIPTAFDINGGFAVTDRFAIIGGAYTHKNRDVEEYDAFSGNQHDSSNLLYRHNGFTLGAGTFFPLSQRSSTYLSFYGGLSKGSFKMSEEFFQVRPTPSASPVENFYNSRLNRYFLQGSLNVYGKPVEVSTTIRYNLVEYKKIRTDYTENQLSDYRLPPFVHNRSTSFFDFSMDAKLFFSNHPRVGVLFYGVVSTMVSGVDEAAGKYNYHYYPFRVGTGLVFRGLSDKAKWDK